MVCCLSVSLSCSVSLCISVSLSLVALAKEALAGEEAMALALADEALASELTGLRLRSLLPVSRSKNSV